MKINKQCHGLIAFFITIFISACFWGTLVQARIVKIAVPKEKRTERDTLFHWWPELPAINWWRQEREASIASGSNVFVPLGADVTRAEALITARAVEKRLTLCFNLGEFIFYQKRLLLEEDDKAIEFVKSSTVTTGDGKKLLGFIVIHKKTGAVEHLLYGEEGNFYTIFSLKARDRKAYLHALQSYKDLLGRYQGKGQ